MRIFGISLGRPETKQPEGLISVLLDRSAPDADRDDAATDLSEYDEPEVEEALLSVVLDHADEEIVIDSAGESLYQIWERKGKHDATLVASMHPSAQEFFNLEPRADATGALPQGFVVPPHVMDVRVQPKRVLIEFSDDFDPRIAQTLGGHLSNEMGAAAWEFPAPDDKAAGAVLEALRDRGVPFRWMEGGWPPAAVFEELRKRGFVAGTVSALTYYGHRWTLREL